MLYALEQVLAGRKAPITVRYDAPVIDALHLMMEFRLSQLPVIGDEGLLRGIISYQTLLSLYYITDGKVSLLDLAVDDCMEPAHTLALHEDLLRAVDLLRRRGTYAIVVTQDERPVGILTGKDMSVFFHSLFEGMLMVERIENQLRGAIASVFPEPADLNQALLATFGPSKGQPDRPARGGRYLTFADLLALIGDNNNWPRFQPTFGRKELFETLMDRVRVVRNGLAHFHGHPDALEIDTLRRAVIWLNNRPPLPATASATTSEMTAEDGGGPGLQTLARVLQGRRPPVCARPETPLRESLHVMIENRYGQLPVIDEHGRYVGMVSQRSILRTYYHTEGAVGLLDLPTTHCMDAVPVLQPDADLFTAVEMLAASGVFAAVVLEDGKPVGLLTGKDMTHFFRTLFEGIILVERIEMRLRDYAATAFPDTASLNAAARAAFGPHSRNPEWGAGNPTRLSLGDRLQFMCDDDLWPIFDPVLGPRDLFMHLMDRVRRVRNALLHFTGNLSYPEYDALLRAHTWLHQRQPLNGPAPALSPEQGAQTGGGRNPYVQFMQRHLRTSVPAVARGDGEAQAQEE